MARPILGTKRTVTKNIPVQHHLTLRFSPWSNGSVEKFRKKVIRVFRSVLSALQMQKEEWCDLLPVVQSVINHFPSPQRGNVCRMTAFTVLKPLILIITFIWKCTASPLSIDQLTEERRLEIEKLREVVLDMNAVVQVEQTRNRNRGRQKISTDELPKFTVGDYVLVAKSNFLSGEKFSLRCRGPR